MSDIMDEVWKEVDAEFDRIGAKAVAIAKESGNYKDRTGRLRKSNYHKVADHTLEFGNSAPYASFVSSRGYDVIDTAVSYLRKETE